MDETRRSLIKGMLTGGTLLAFGIPTVTQAVSIGQTLSDSARNCQLLLGNTPIDEAFAKGAQAACTRYSSFSQEGALSTFQLTNELLIDPLRIAELLTQSRNMRWVAIMDYANAAIFTELVRNSERRLLALGSHMSTSSNNASLPLRHVWTTASSAYSAGGLLASLLVQNQPDFSIVENFLEQAKADSAMKDSSLAGFSSYLLAEKPATYLHCAGISPLEASQLLGWKASKNWESASSGGDESSINQDQTAPGATLEHLRFDNWIEATGYAVVATAMGMGTHQEPCSSRAFVHQSGQRRLDHQGLSGNHFASFVIDV
ncbi:hypothetical protein [Nitrosomonas ureae]|uniref:Uncharacterized protein n=1 Tax=Nitrosomonas ureae TaxID=44577 RepID=A0A1H2DRV0_9PROT|nr:hypothetical protein [Nitrosomonas ureae]ALQ50982.1 hypothetical protein ATY38_06920 [Nitrosomonas ureae]SDT85088.1 hypothetical protein SAMN05216406_10370 [Nitrosomonas ureae]